MNRAHEGTMVDKLCRPAEEPGTTRSKHNHNATDNKRARREKGKENRSLGAGSRKGGKSGAKRSRYRGHSAHRGSGRPGDQSAGTRG